ncbi:acyl-CoA dehydrogenase family protein [uncultured Bradyrhizobium sp.]|uniref:acyl-CoA dehydrogenase family protein n=1 Tax=uncultured Bradyrhizobium sp. TaxID=199684 RepID=UPI00260F56DD|nr:acyl-CoA dehydrogenase family protein [uncultured Bradyrhizobium sp.]
MHYRSSWMTEELDTFRDQFRKFLAKDLAPHAETWRAQKLVDRSAWRALGEMGALLPSVPEAYGGLGTTFAYDAAVLDDLESTVPELTTGVSVHSAIVAHYILNYGSEEQKKRWLPRMASGEMVGAIAMTEPGTGSDLQAVKTTAKKQGNSYVINGQKTFITNGQAADLVIVVARTGAAGAKGISLMLLETEGAEGFQRGRKLDKIGMDAADTSELFFDNVFVPAENVLGGVEGRGFYQLMGELPQERLIIAVGAINGIEKALETTMDYVKNRKAFGQTIWDFQNTQFVMADLKARSTAARVFVNDCIARHLKGELDVATACMAKYWVTELQGEVVDKCLQFHGGAGFINDYPIARMYRDSRITRIFGGSNEVMKMVIARGM